MKLIHNILSSSGKPWVVQAAGQPFPNSGGVVVAFSNCQLSIVNCSSSTFHSKFSVLYSKFSFSQGFLYAPFGEITTEYNANFYSNILPKYSFNAKELDEETGMYYYEARYYKPPVFTSRDAMFEKYFWITPYAYCANNPVKYVDPSGEEMELNDDIVLRGQNNSSVTIKTDLVDINVNVSSLGVDFGGNYTLQGDEILSAALDLAGIVDPTGIADGANAVLQAKKGDWLNAGISAVAIIPVVGDVAKVGKIKKDVNIIKNTIKLNNSKSLN